MYDRFLFCCFSFPPIIIICKIVIMLKGIIILYGHQSFVWRGQLDIACVFVCLWCVLLTCACVCV